MSTLSFEKLIGISEELQANGVYTNELTPDEIATEYYKLQKNKKEIEDLKKQIEDLEKQIEDFQKKINDKKELIIKKSSSIPKNNKITKNNTISYIGVVENTNKNTNKNITIKTDVKKPSYNILDSNIFKNVYGIPYIIDNNNNNSTNVAMLIKDNGFYYYKILGPKGKIIKLYIRDHSMITPPAKGGMKTQTKIYEQNKKKSLNSRFYNSEDCNDRRNISEWVQFSSNLNKGYQDVPSLFLPTNSSSSSCLESLKSMNEAQKGFFESIFEYLMYCKILSELNNL